VELPIFPGYVFARFNPGQRTRILEVSMVYSIVSTRGAPTPLPDEEVARLRLALETRQAHPHPYVRVGNRVRVRSGPLAGLEGIVVRTYGGLSVVLSVDMIQKSVAVHVEADELEAASPVTA
jgi:transcription antitermination factor NusG